MDKTQINRLIKALGGTGKVAELCDVSDCAVSQWKKREVIPNAQLKYLRLKRPKVFKSLNLTEGK